MEFWNSIIQTAMLGTDKKQVAVSDVPEELSDAVESINGHEAIDTEEKFLQTTALAFNYRQSGSMPVKQTAGDLPVAEAEDKSYCNPQALQVLTDILYEGSQGLLRLWLQACVQKQQVVTPLLVPVLLDKSVEFKNLKALVQECVGNRGVWLSQFNKEWTFVKLINDEALWQTGKPEQRRNILLQLRNTHPAKALELLQQTWTEENANSKTELLKVLSTGLSEDDAPWLESLLEEKSQKVKEEALRLLKQTPQSSLVQLFANTLQKTVSIKKEKVLLGLSSKNILHFELPKDIDENIYRYGIEKLSSVKNFTDDAFIVYQLIQSVPPSFLEKQLSLAPKEILQLFQKDESKEKFIPALAASIARFNDKEWAISLMQSVEHFYPELLSALPVKEQEAYCCKYFKGNENMVMEYAEARTTEWGSEFALAILQYTAKNVYSYNRSFYNKYIHLVPVHMERDECIY